MLQVLGVSVFGVLAGVIGALWGWINRENYKTENAGLEAAKARLEAEKASLGADLREALKFSPGEWLAHAERLRNAGQDDQAAHVLRIGLDNVQRDLANAAFLLATHHAERAAVRPEELGEARSLARIASMLDPRAKDMAALAGELDEIAAQSHFDEGRFDPQDPAWSAPVETRSPEDAAALITTLQGRATTHLNEGHYFMALRVASFATRIARGASLYGTAVGCVARFALAQALHFNGRNAEALAEIEAYAPIEARALGAEHPNVLATRRLRAQTLSDLGRNAEALAEIEAYAPIRARVLGAEHPNVLATRYLRAQTLSGLGRNAEALAEFEAYAPIEARVLGAEHPDVLATRYLRARTLSGLGRNAEALAEIEAYAPIQARVLGAEHPNVLTTRQLRARTLSGLGRAAEA